MRRPTLGRPALVACAVLLALALAPSWAVASPGRSGVTIDAYPKGVFGQVTSPRPRCRVGRTVVVLRQMGRHEHPAADRRIGRARTHRLGRRGVWSERTRADGRFYARVLPTRACRRAHSRPTSDMPRGTEVPDCPTASGFCRFSIHWDTRLGYCADFRRDAADCTGYVTQGNIPWCCVENDSVRWEPSGNRRFVSFFSTWANGPPWGKRWDLTGYLNGPGDGALKEARTRNLVVDYGGSTPDLAGAGAGTMGGPLHFNFEGGFLGADIYVDGYFLHW